MPQSIEIGKQLVKCPESICNTMNERFVTIGEKIWANLNRTTEQGFKKFLGERLISSIVLRPTDEHGIIGILASVSNNKLPVYIDILVTLIKTSKFVIARYLLNLCNRCKTNGSFVDILIVAKVVALHKEGSKSGS